MVPSATVFAKTLYITAAHAMGQHSTPLKAAGLILAVFSSLVIASAILCWIAFTIRTPPSNSLLGS